jgi:hypothetical protein
MSSGAIFMLREQLSITPEIVTAIVTLAPAFLKISTTVIVYIFSNSGAIVTSTFFMKLSF